VGSFKHMMWAWRENPTWKAVINRE
jgi:hypothetical protein